ncbi:Maf family protein [Bifidobacterium sp. ESL0800]|uniref:Maf family protein n=1 Tax=Bifidobacterium sp. ESL0800 TaxID=2983236 RepID=UPI0023F9EB87|nr:Maf family protein [Bifidobacterium sp. ESL0800]WEV75616.1 Maf family protein [Bifidobacterium sp. ESL0800]
MSIPLILASQSPSRRNVLNAAGISPIIHVSHVDEPAAVAAEAKARGVAVDDLSCEQRVMILAQAKARSVYQAYLQVAEAARNADGEQVTAFPLHTESAADAGSGNASVGNGSVAGDGSAGAGNGNTDQYGEKVYDHHSTLTRDFSGVEVPTEAEPMERALAEYPGFADAKVGPLIIGCDSMFLFEGVALGKPHTPEVARERLSAMRGKSGELWTGHCLIDFATGRQKLESSHAVVRFGDYSDRDIEAYIASGEPLEVAGCFTLEGLGGAFIAGVDGDPSGVLGLSLPLLRRMVGDMGVAWPDLWNAGLGKVAATKLSVRAALNAANDMADGADSPSATNTNCNTNGKSLSTKTKAEVAAAKAKADAEAQAASIVPPKDNVHQPGDGWVQCACGRRHWGLNGAAGVLLARRSEETGEVTDVVMQHRAMWSAEGGTWGIPGGALADGESPIEGALRESYEEANITPEDIEVVGTHREEHGPWAYTTVFAFEKPGCRVSPHPNDDESMEIAWIPVSEVPNRKLLTAMNADWPHFVERLGDLAREYRHM